MTNLILYHAHYLFMLLILQYDATRVGMLDRHPVVYVVHAYRCNKTTNRSPNMVVGRGEMCEVINVLYL